MSRVGALEDRLAGARSELRLAILGFLSHDGARDALPDYLICLYHSMRTAGDVMRVALERSEHLASECPAARRMVPFWASHIREEAGHDRWLLADLARLGVDRDAVVATPPHPIVAELMGTLYFWALHTHPVAVLGYFWVFEGSPPSVALLDWMVEARLAPRAALQTFYRHAAIDVEHGRELRALIDELELTDPQEKLLARGSETALDQTTRLFRSLTRGSGARGRRSRPAEARSRRTDRAPVEGQVVRNTMG